MYCAKPDGDVYPHAHIYLGIPYCIFSSSFLSDNVLVNHTCIDLSSARVPTVFGSNSIDVAEGGVARNVSDPWYPSSHLTSYQRKGQSRGTIDVNDAGFKFRPV